MAVTWPRGWAKHPHPYPPGIHHTAIIVPGTVIGANPRIGPYAVVGSPGEHSDRRPWNYGNVVVGDNVEIHEHARIQSGFDRPTVLGDNVLLMAGSHVAHDCLLGNRVTISPGVVLGGSSVLEDDVTVGMNVSVHQRSIIRAGSMIGAQSFFKGETGPNELWYGVPATNRGVNRAR